MSNQKPHVSINIELPSLRVNILSALLIFIMIALVKFVFGRPFLPDDLYSILGAALAFLITVTVPDTKIWLVILRRILLAVLLMLIISVGFYFFKSIAIFPVEILFSGKVGRSTATIERIFNWETGIFRVEPTPRIQISRIRYKCANEYLEEPTKPDVSLDVLTVEKGQDGKKIRLNEQDLRSKKIPYVPYQIELVIQQEESSDNPILIYVITDKIYPQEQTQQFLPFSKKSRLYRRIYVGEEGVWNFIDNTKDYPVKSASFKITEQSLKNLKSEEVPDDVLEKLKILQDQEVIGEEKFLDILKEKIGNEQTVSFESLILKYSVIPIVSSSVGPLAAILAVEFKDGKPICRSRLVFVLRKGILHPDDDWFDSDTLNPYISKNVERVAFLSPEDITKKFLFVSRLDGSDITNIASLDKRPKIYGWREETPEISALYFRGLTWEHPYYKIRVSKNNIIGKPIPLYELLPMGGIQ